MSIPAEHRTFADLDIPGDLMARKNVGQHVKYEPSTNEVWPYSRSEASQIKASILSFYSIDHHLISVASVIGSGLV